MAGNKKSGRKKGVVFGESFIFRVTGKMAAEIRARAKETEQTPGAFLRGTTKWFLENSKPQK